MENAIKINRHSIANENRTLLLRSEKQCSKCLKIKNLSEYHLDKYTEAGHASKCKECVHEYSLSYSTRSAIRRRKLRYNLDNEDYLLLVEQQKGKCAICQTKEPKGRNNKFHIDHDHSTGKVRGLLCHHCNVALGSFFDNIQFLKNAIKYLENANN